MTENPIHRDASPELRGDLYAVIVRELDVLTAVPAPGITADRILSRILPIIASVDANAHARGRAEAVETLAPMLVETPAAEPVACTCGRTCDQCAKHDPRNRPDHGHLPASMCPEHSSDDRPAPALCRCSVVPLFDTTAEAETFDDVGDDDLPSPEEIVLLRVERALEAHFDAADGTIPAALVRSGIRSALNTATNEFSGW